MKALTSILVLAGLMHGVTVASAATFHNLDFESAVEPLGPFFAPIAKAMPGWHAYIGGAELTEVLFDSATGGAPFVGLYSPAVGVIQGNYTAVLGPSAMTSVSLSQTGVVPGDTESLRFLVQVSSGPRSMSLDNLFGVFVNDQRLPLVPLRNETAGSVFGADLSSFAGTDVTLKFSCFAVGQPNGALLDSISFSSEPIPEPSILALMGLSGALLCHRLWPKKKIKSEIAFRKANVDVSLSACEWPAVLRPDRMLGARVERQGAAKGWQNGDYLIGISGTHLAKLTGSELTPREVWHLRPGRVRHRPFPGSHRSSACEVVQVSTATLL